MTAPQVSDHVDLLSEVVPFDRLPGAELSQLAATAASATLEPQTTLYEQNTTRVTHVIVVVQGRLKQTLMEDDQVLFSGYLERGDLYGGLSLLFNKGLSISTVESQTRVSLLKIPKSSFLQLCSAHAEVLEHFTSRFSTNLLERPYLSFLTRQAREQRTSSEPLNISVGEILSSPPLTCQPDTPVREAARLMNRFNAKAVLVPDAAGQTLGLVTDQDFRARVVAGNLPDRTPVKEVMTSPVEPVDSNLSVCEVMVIMLQSNQECVPVSDETGSLLGVVTEQDLLLAQGLSPLVLLRRVQNETAVSGLAFLYRQLPALLMSLIKSGARAGLLTRIISATTHTMLLKTIEFGLAQLGPPPVDFAFLLFGSEGRREQTLKTDQDNAIVYRDVGPDLEAEVRAYFLELGTRVCDWLNQAGQSYCEFNIMAKNPDWCQPLKTWKGYFQDWVRSDDPDTLLKGNIFFDLELGYGEQGLVDELHDSLFASLSQWPGFLRRMAVNTTSFRPPLDMFGQFVLHNREDRKSILDLKSPMRLVVDFARIYALKLQVREANTMERLNRLKESETFEQDLITDIMEAYEWLMILRLRHQAEMATESSRQPDNFINPKQLTHIDRQSLKQAFKAIKTIQGLLRRDFFLFGPFGS
jgi:CBS domain-containing protein